MDGSLKIKLFPLHVDFLFLVFYHSNRKSTRTTHQSQHQHQFSVSLGKTTIPAAKCRQHRQTEMVVNFALGRKISGAVISTGSYIQRAESRLSERKSLSCGRLYFLSTRACKPAWILVNFRGHSHLQLQLLLRSAWMVPCIRCTFWLGPGWPSFYVNEKVLPPQSLLPSFLNIFSILIF